ncbi:hypothetical protein C2845_PM07G05430 [Panicum miliaceum]|uniref:NB-ARC domain-containing protein n=1 Tax=Panicum miliaceum TaxID=4540 RepID=A0A3L6SUA0_PANMI|nr:hypothetical protein C2845_PM07G05430 [Panicum miliaceum]
MSVGSSLRSLVQPIVSATKEKCDLDNLDAVASFLSRTFTGMKYLLVLDDVWSENQEEWEKLRMLLKEGKRGSKIIVTTRSQKVAMMVGTVPPFVLKGLSDDDCWELFRCKAFEEGEEDLHPKLVNVGIEIVQKCGGVPLAAKALGSMLRFNKIEQSWVAVKDSEIWQMEKEETILPSLKLSYDQMPPGRKQCFAYCSVFPRNHETDRDKLIQQWFALGFVEPAKRLRVPDLRGSPDIELPQSVGKLKHLRPKLEDLVIEYCETLHVLPEAIRSLGTFAEPEDSELRRAGRPSRMAG